MEFLTNDRFQQLANSLNRNDAWLKVVNYLNVFDKNEMLSTLQTPGERLLIGLCSKECTLQNLCTILEECELFDALSILCTKKIQIEKQLDDNLKNNKLFVGQGKELRLEFVVNGIPKPTYCWYHNNVLIPHQNASVLFIQTYRPEMEGNYYSIAVQQFNNKVEIETLQSHRVHVETLPEKCKILKQPASELCVMEGKHIVLNVEASGYPLPTYQWIHNDKILLQHNKNCLKICKASKQIVGRYRCCVSNQLNDIMIQTEIKLQEDNNKTTTFLPVYNGIISEKIALLIANEQYENQPILTTPINDTNLLKTILESYGFLVLRVTNETFLGMQNAIQTFVNLLVPDSIVFYYYAGHGFQLNDKHMLPVDASTSYRLQDTIAENWLLKNVLETKPKLFVSLLDMCLILPNRSENSEIYREQNECHVYETKRNLITGYSTTRGLSAYENQNDAHSLYTLALKKYLAQDLSIMKVLANVNREIEHMTPVQQMPSVWYNITEDFHFSIKKQGNPATVTKFNEFYQKQQQQQQ